MTTIVDPVAKKNKGNQYSDKQRLEMFMESFHVLSQTTFWPNIRKLGRVNIYGKVEVTQRHGSGEPTFRESLMDPMQAQLAGAYVRKYLTGADAISIDKVFASAEIKKIGPSASLAEVKFQWDQLAGKPFEFLAKDGKVVAFVAKDDEGNVVTIEFHGHGADVVDGAYDGRCPVTLTIRDFATVFFYDGFLHAKDHRQDEGNRPLVRSIPPVLQTIMSHMALSGSLYAATILHWLISEAEPQWCPSNCQERAIMKSLREDESTEDEGA